MLMSLERSEGGRGGGRCGERGSWEREANASGGCRGEGETGVT
jgi:hypothetical protein